MPIYSAYGLSIDSDIDIPELPLVGSSGPPPEISFRYDTVPEVDHLDIDGTGQAYRINTNETVYAKDKCGRFLIRNGREILVQKNPEAEDRVMRLSLFGPALGLLLMQRGLLVLHGGAVVFNGQVAVVLGPGGAGKSTMTAELFRQGGGLLTDDLVAVDMNQTPPVVLPGVPLLKLWPDAADMAPEDSNSNILHPDFDKIGCRLPDSALATPAPLAKIYLLGGGEELELKALGGIDAFRAIMMSLFAVRYGETFISGMDRQRMLRDVSLLLKSASVSVLRRPQDRGLLPATSALIIEDITE